jgi:hypothetical protein
MHALPVRLPLGGDDAIVARMTRFGEIIGWLSSWPMTCLMSRRILRPLARLPERTPARGKGTLVSLHGERRGKASWPCWSRRRAVLEPFGDAPRRCGRLPFHRQPER